MFTTSTCVDQQLCSDGVLCARAVVPPPTRLQGSPSARNNATAECLFYKCDDLNTVQHERMGPEDESEIVLALH